MLPTLLLAILILAVLALLPYDRPTTMIEDDGDAPALRLKATRQR